jgi:hypothetical protein
MNRSFGRENKGCLAVSGSPIEDVKNLKGWTVPFILLASCFFLYLQVFIFPDVPRSASGDQAIFLDHATRMLEGQVIYRDFYHFTPPGVDLVYLAPFKLFGVGAWIPEAMLILLGVGLAWLSIVISRKVMTGPAVYLPGLLFLVFPFSSLLEGLHHWYSALAVMAALAVLIENRSVARLACAGALCGLATCFTQSEVLATVGLGLFLLWESRRNRVPCRSLLKKEGYLISSFLATVLAFNGYFVWKAGLRRFFYHTAVFVEKYFLAGKSGNWKVYMGFWPSVHIWPNWPDLAAWPFIHALIPLVYILFFVRYCREARRRPEKPWDRLMLVNVMGVFMFLSVAPSPAYVRLYCVSLPGLVVLSWFLDLPFRAERFLRRSAWAAVLVLGLVKPVIAQVRWRACLSLPTGRTAFLSPAQYEKCRWLSARTQPFEYFFGDSFLCFALRLRNPARVPFVTPTDFTRPEEVQELLQVLEKHRVRFVCWYNGLEPSGLQGDHLDPLRLYLSTYYHVAKTFSNFDQIWERNNRLPHSSESLDAAGEGESP